MQVTSICKNKNWNPYLLSSLAEESPVISGSGISRVNGATAGNASCGADGACTAGSSTVGRFTLGDGIRLVVDWQVFSRGRAEVEVFVVGPKVTGLRITGL